MIKIRALYIFTLFPAFLFSQTKNFIEKKDSLLPGTITSIPFTVENKFSVRTSYDLTVETSDPNIIPILTKGEIEISPAEKTIYLVPVKIASETPHGKYGITLYGSEKSTGEKFSKHFEFIISGLKTLIIKLK